MPPLLSPLSDFVALHRENNMTDQTLRGFLKMVENLKYCSLIGMPGVKKMIPLLSKFVV